MRFGLPSHRITLALLAALCPALAQALGEPYEGRLVSASGDAPIPIAVELRDAGSFLTGTVNASAPLDASATIQSGRKIAEQCDLTVVLNRTVTLRLYGSCGPTIFQGDYTIKYAERKTSSRGTFRLVRKASEPAGGNATSSAGASAGSLAACQKANTRCLTTCPRGEYNLEFVCANGCRTKLQACKARVNKAPATGP